MKIDVPQSGGCFEPPLYLALSRLLLYADSRKVRRKVLVNFETKCFAAITSRKSIISAVTSGSQDGDTLAPVGAQTTGVLTIDRIPGITPEARPALRVRDILAQRPTTMQVVDYVRVNTPMSIASPVPVCVSQKR